MSVKEISPGP